MGGSAKAALDLLERRIKFALRPLINAINASGMNRERRLELDALLQEIAALRQRVESDIEVQDSTESRTRLAGLVDNLYSLIKGAEIPVSLPERRQYPRSALIQGQAGAESVPEAKSVKIVNVSMGGMRLRSPTPMKIGRVIRAQLKSAAGKVISLQGEVIWVKSEDNTSGYIIGVHFLPMDKETAAALERHLEKHND